MGVSWSGDAVEPPSRPRRPRARARKPLIVTAHHVVFARLPMWLVLAVAVGIEKHLPLSDWLCLPLNMGLCFVTLWAIDRAVGRADMELALRAELD